MEVLLSCKTINGSITHPKEKIQSKRVKQLFELMSHNCTHVHTHPNTPTHTHTPIARETCWLLRFTPKFGILLNISNTKSCLFAFLKHVSTISMVTSLIYVYNHIYVSIKIRSIDIYLENKNLHSMSLICIIHRTYLNSFLHHLE